MNSPHKNARTFVYSREQIVLRHRQGQSDGQIATAFGISIRTVYKWLKRFGEEGVIGLSNRPSAPKSNPNAYIMGWCALIEKLRKLRMSVLEIA